MEILRDYFKAKGYNVVALPSAALTPLQLLARNGSHLTALGNRLDDLFRADAAALPGVRRNLPAPALEGQEVFALEASAGLGVLKDLLAYLQLGRLTANAGLSNSDKILFSFGGVQEDAVAGMLDLDGFLSGAIPEAAQFRTYQDKLKNSELFVITGTLKCREFHVKVVDKHAQNISATLDVEHAVSVQGQVKREQDNSVRIFHSGKTDLVFAFKAVQIRYDKPAWFNLWDPRKAGFTIKARAGWTLRDESDFPVSGLNPGDALAVM